MKNFSLVIFLISITGCAPMKWNHPNNTEADFYRDSMQCEGYARQIVQQSKAQPARSYREPAYNTQCQGNVYTNTVECRTERDRTNENYDREYQQGQDLGNALFGGIALRGHYSNCMKSLGYIQE